MAKLIPLTALLVLFAVLFAGCGGADDPLGAATIALDNQDYAQVIDIINNLMTPAEQNTVEVQRMLALAHFRRAEYEESKAAYQRGMELDPGNPHLLLGAARAGLHQGRRRSDPSAAERHFYRAADHARQALDLDPQLAEAHVVLARINVSRGDIRAQSDDARRRGQAQEYYLEADNHFEQALTLAPDNGEWKLERAELVAERLRDHDRAGQILEQTRESQPDLARARLVNAQMLARRRQFDEAIAELKAAIEAPAISTEDRVNAMQMLTHLSLQIGELDTARRVAHELAQFDPRQAGFRHYILGAVAYRERDWQAVYDHLSNLNVSEARDRRLLMWMGEAEERLGMEHQAMSRYRQILERVDRDDIYARTKLAQMLARQGAYDDAMEHCRAVLNERPGQRDALLLKARLYQSRRSAAYDLDKAHQLYVRALAHHPDLARGIHLELAELALNNNDPGRAYRHLEVAGEEEKDAGYHLVLGKIHLYLHRAGVQQDPESDVNHVEAAIESIETARGMEPDHPDVVGTLARAYIAADRTDRAIALLNQYISNHPDEFRGYLMLARIFEDTDRHDRALETLERAVRRARPADQRRALIALGRAYFNQGNMRQAISTWSQADTRGARLSVGVMAPLTVAMALDGQEQLALDRVRTVYHRAEESRLIAVLASAVATYLGRYDQAGQYLSGQNYPSSEQKNAYLEFPEACRNRGEQGRQAAAQVAQGMAHLLFGTPDVAARNFRRAADLLPRSIVPRYLMGTAYRQDGQMAEFVRTYEQMTRDFPGHGLPHLMLAEVYQRHPEFDGDARQSLQRALERDPELAPAYVMKARLLLSEADQRANPERDLTEAARHARRAADLSEEVKLSALLLAGDAYSRLAHHWRVQALRQSSLEEGRQYLRRVEEAATSARGIYGHLRRAYPDSTEVLKQSVRLELRQGEFSRASGLLRGRISDAEDPELVQLAAEARIGMGDEHLATASELLQRAIRMGADAQAYRRLAAVQARIGGPTQVLQIMTQAVRRYPQDIGLRFEYADWLRNYGHLSSAAQFYEEVVSGIPPTEGDVRLRELRRRSLIGLADCLVRMAMTQSGEQRGTLLAQAASRVENLADPPDDAVRPDPAALVLLGRIRDKQGRTDRALELLDRCIELDPDNLDARHWKAVILYDNGRYAEAAEIYAGQVIPAARRAGQHPAEWQTRLALAQLATGAPAGLRNAQGTVDGLVQMLEDYGSAGIALGSQQENRARSAAALVYIANGHSDRARTQARRLRGLDSGRMAGYLAILTETGQNRDKRAQFAEQFRTVLFHENTPRQQQATDALEKLTGVFPNNLLLLGQLGDLYIRQGRSSDYEAILERSIKAADSPGTTIEPDDLLVLYERLIDRHRQRGAEGERHYLDEAVRVVQRGIEVLGKRPELLGRQAAIQWERGRPDDAIRTLQEMAALSDPGRSSWISAKRQLARFHYHAGQMDKAVEIAKEIDQHVEDDYQWFNETAWYHANAPVPDLSYALQKARRAKRLAPTDPRIRDTLGWIYYHLERYYDALPELEYAAAVLRHDPNVLYHYGAALYQVGRTEEANEQLQRAIRLGRDGRPFRYDRESRQLLGIINPG